MHAVRPSFSCAQAALQQRAPAARTEAPPQGAPGWGQRRALRSASRACSSAPAGLARRPAALAPRAPLSPAGPSPSGWGCIHGCTAQRSAGPSSRCSRTRPARAGAEALALLGCTAGPQPGAAQACTAVLAACPPACPVGWPPGLSSVPNLPAPLFASGPLVFPVSGTSSEPQGLTYIVFKGKNKDTRRQRSAQEVL